MRENQRILESEKLHKRMYADGAPCRWVPERDQQLTLALLVRAD